MQAINDVITLDRDGAVAVIEINSPPVNALSDAVRSGLANGLDEALADNEVQAIVIACAGPTFSVGADIKKLGKPRVEPTLPQVLAKIESSAKPVVVAMHGTVLGGGLELALSAHYRIAATGTRFGLPEVNIGILPGAGGTQRLPRLVGIENALDIMTSGRQVSSADALDMGLVNRLAPPAELRAMTMNFAKNSTSGDKPLPKVRDLALIVPQNDTGDNIFDVFRKKNAKKFRGFLAPESIIQSVEAATRLAFDEGLTFERSMLDRLLAEKQAPALRHVFFAERQGGKIEDIGPDIPRAQIQKVGVIGAGTMGGGIAMNFLNLGIPTVIVDMNDAGLKRGISTIKHNYDNSVKRGKLTTAKVDEQMDMLTGATDLAEVSDCDLVIEAVFEDMNVKKDIFQQLDQICRPDTILATNTSYLDVDEIATSVSHPDRFLGLHFFSPAHIMQLLEIVRAEKTGLNTLATAIDLGKAIGKTAVTVRNGWGFVGNRILQARQREVEQLNLEGAAVEDLDRVLYDFGFPMGHFQMRDLVGLDVGWDRNNTASRTVREILNEMGRHGQKTGGGYYDYDESRNRTASPIAQQVIAEFAKREGIAQRVVGNEEIHDRALYAMVNEGAKILEEGTAMRPSDIDVIWVTGYGWPKYRGGPMFWADLVGLSKIVKRLDEFAEIFGDEHRPAELLRDLAAKGSSFGDMAAQ